MNNPSNWTVFIDDYWFPSFIRYIFSDKWTTVKVDGDVVSAWVKQLGDMLKDYAFEDIYNADETGLFFKCRPSKTFNIIGEKCFNGERSKERLTSTAKF